AGIFVAYVFDEQQDQDVVFVLAGIHAATQLVATGPERAIEFRFLKSHCFLLLRFKPTGPLISHAGRIDYRTLSTPFFSDPPCFPRPAQTGIRTPRLTVSSPAPTSPSPQRSAPAIPPARPLAPNRHAPPSSPQTARALLPKSSPASASVHPPAPA